MDPVFRYIRIDWTDGGQVLDLTKAVQEAAPQEAQALCYFSLAT
jgi:hypothetical protein